MLNEGFIKNRGVEDYAMDPISAAFAASNLVISGISALSAVIQAYKTLQDLEKTGAPPDLVKRVEEDIDKLADMALQEGRPLTEEEKKAAEELSRAIIDKEDLEDLKKEIKKAKDRFREAKKKHGISSPQTIQARDKCNQDVCSALRIIKSWNGGVLPGDWFYNLWAQHGCA